MTPDERARALVPNEWVGTTEERVAMIASAIRAAEDEALERAARSEEDRGYVVASYIAARIRSLKSKPPSSAPGGERP